MWVGQRRGLRQRVVAAEGQHAAVPADAREVGVLEDVAGAVDPGPLPYHIPSTPSYSGCGKQVGELAAVDDGGAEILVDAGDEDYVVLARADRPVALER